MKWPAIELPIGWYIKVPIVEKFLEVHAIESEFFEAAGKDQFFHCFVAGKKIVRHLNYNNHLE